MKITCIVSDFDGTLLDDAKRLPEQFPALLDALDVRGIRLIAASGRQYYNIREQLPNGMADRVDYIAENGALTVVGGEICTVEQMPEQDISDIIRTVRETPGCFPILCGADGAYLENDDEELHKNADLYYARLTRVSDVLEYISRDRICKIAVFNSHHAEQTAYPALLPFADRMQVALSGDCWVDVMNLPVNKGAALCDVLDRLHLAPEQCMAFGDYLNDVQLLECSGHPYAMRNGHPLLWERFPHADGSNNEGGVIQTICRELNITL